MKRFAVFDIDGTLVRWQLYHAITDSLAERGHINPATYRKLKDARLAWKRRQDSSFRDYELQVIDMYHQMLHTLTPAQLDEAIDSVFSEYKDQVYVYTRDLVKRLKSEGYFLLAISGSHSEIVAKIADYYGFDSFTGTEYHRTGNSFSGDMVPGYKDKDKTLKRQVKTHGLTYEDSLAIGDSRSDAAMMELVEKPIAFNPEENLYKIAVEKGWPIVIERKNMIYELERVNGKYQLVKTNAG